MALRTMRSLSVGNESGRLTSSRAKISKVLSPTCSADSIALIENQVLSRVGMSMGAMSACSDARCQNTSPNIFADRNWLKMIWANADLYTAKMIELSSVDIGPTESS